jgi:nitrite reductase/ring-hydroxylating ferredoxin subunit/Fe-S cluster biogenesis protein NfuA
MNAPRESISEIPNANAQAELARLVGAITRSESIVAGWESAQIEIVEALKSAIEDLHKEALKRLIRTLRDDPSALERLRGALADPIIFGVLTYHGLLKEPLANRIQKAFDEVRPFMHEHGGDVELVAMRLPDTIEIRLTGSCHGCPASSQTLTEGVERAVRKHCPEIVHILQVSRGAPESAKADRESKAGSAGVAKLHFVSPFASPSARESDDDWIDAASLVEIPEGGVTERRIKERSVLLSRFGQRVSCFDNRCAHLGMSLEMGEVRDGVITCAYHGFRYLLETGECLTAPEVQLRVHAVRVLGERVQVRLEG